jgi:hypothetical protein
VSTTEAYKARQYKGFTGINNVDPPFRMGYDEGLIPLQEASNVDIDRTYAVMRAKGRRQLLSGDYHSLWSDEGVVLAVKDTTLMKLGIVDFTTPVISEAPMLTGLDRGNPVTYARNGEIVYFTNNVIIGYLRSSAASRLPLPTQPFKRVMPAGHLIEVFASRLLVARDNRIFYSDGGGSISRMSRYDERYAVRARKGKVRMLKGVNTGLFVSDDTGICYYEGLNPVKWRMYRIADYKVIPGTAETILGLKFGDSTIKKAVVMMTEKGVCLGLDGGQFINLTEHRYIPDAGARGFSVFVRRPPVANRHGILNQYICGIES